MQIVTFLKWSYAVFLILISRCKTLHIIAENIYARWLKSLEIDLQLKNGFRKILPNISTFFTPWNIWKIPWKSVLTQSWAKLNSFQNPAQILNTSCKDLQFNRCRLYTKPESFSKLENLIKNLVADLHINFLSS